MSVTSHKRKSKAVVEIWIRANYSGGSICATFEELLIRIHQNIYRGLLVFSFNKRGEGVLRAKQYSVGGMRLDLQ